MKNAVGCSGLGIVVAATNRQLATAVLDENPTLTLLEVAHEECKGE